MTKIFVFMEFDKHLLLMILDIYSSIIEVYFPKRFFILCFSQLDFLVPKRPEIF